MAGYSVQVANSPSIDHSKDTTKLCFWSFAQLAFPHGHDAPIIPPEFNDLPSVAGLVGIQLGVPEAFVGLRPGRLTVRATVPEATMHKYGNTLAYESDIGATWSFLVMEAITGVPMLAQHLAQRKLRTGVGATDPAHKRARSRILGYGGTAISEVGHGRS